MYYNDVTRTWYDPRAPIVGKYAPRVKARPAAHSPVHTRYIGDVWAEHQARADRLARKAAYVAVRR